MQFWQCPICQGLHPEEVFECPFGPNTLDEENEE
jgi:hypothetical protein